VRPVPYIHIVASEHLGESIHAAIVLFQPCVEQFHCIRIFFNLFLLHTIPQFIYTQEYTGAKDACQQQREVTMKIKIKTKQVDKLLTEYLCKFYAMTLEQQKNEIEKIAKIKSEVKHG